MTYSSNEVKVGLMVAVGLTILMLFLVAIFGVRWEKNTKDYRTYLENVPGIVVGSLVKYGGMDVGSVSGITLPDATTGQEKIEVRLKVDEKTPVRVNSQAFISAVGIMRDKHIEISSGTPDASYLPPGSVLQGKEVADFMQMAEPFGDLSAKAEVLLERLSDLLNEENRSHLTSILASVDTLLSTGGKQFLSLTENLDNLTRNLASISADMDDLMSENKPHLSGTLANLDSTTRETAMLVAEMRKSATMLNEMLSANSSSFIDMMENFQYTSQNLEEFSRMVKERPWLLVRKAAPSERKIP